MFVAIVGGFALLAVLQVPAIIKNKWWRDLAVYGFFYLLALGVALAFVFDWPVPSPIKALTLVMTEIYKLLGYHISD